MHRVLSWWSANLPKLPRSVLGESENEMRILYRSITVWLLIVIGESINGTLREIFLVPALGMAEAKQVSFLTALVVISAITLMSIRWIGAATTTHLLLIGAMWAGLMLSFEWALGKFVFGSSFKKFAAEYDPRQGGMMSIGMLFLIFIPLIAYRIRR